MRKNIFKRLVSFVLVFMMVLSGMQPILAETSEEPSEKDIKLSKTATPVADEPGTYEIQLTVTGKDIVTGKKADVILVIDNSNSMHLEKYNGKSLAEITREAAYAFIDGVLTEANDASGNVRVAVVQYGTDAKAYQFNHEEWSSNWGRNLNLDEDQVFTKDKESAKDAVDSATTVFDNSNHGGTNTEGGFLMAQKIAEKTRDGAESIVVFMTDGLPTFRYNNSNNSVSDGWLFNSGGSSTSKDELNEAILAAQSLSLKSTIYTVGLLSAFEATSNEARLAGYLLSSEPSPRLYTSNRNTGNIINYVNISGRWGSTSSYAEAYYPIFAGVNAADKMKEIYTDLAAKIVALANGKVTDVISEYFELTEEARAMLESDPNVTLSDDGSTIVFNNVPAGGTPKTLSFKVKAKPGYYGTGYTNEGAFYDYTLNTEGGGSGTMEFEKPVALFNTSAIDDRYTTNQGIVLNVKADEGILDNDSKSKIQLHDDDYQVSEFKVYFDNAESTSKIITIIGGVVVLNKDGSFTFTSEEGFTGITEFNYKNYVTVFKEGGDLNGDYVSNEATVTIEVLPFKSIKIPVEKEWLSEWAELSSFELSAINKPDRVTVYLVKDNVRIAETTLYEKDDWRGYFTVPLNDSDGNEIDYYDGSYTIEEEALDNYIPYVTVWEGEFFAVTNVPLLNVPVEKVWEGPAGKEVTINLLDPEGQPTEYTLTLNENNGWKDSFKLPTLVENENGSLIPVNYSDYTIEEIELDGYEVDIDGSVDEGFVVTNTAEIEIIEAEIYKVNWNYETGYMTDEYDLEDSGEYDDSTVEKNEDGGIDLLYYIELGDKEGYSYSHYDYSYETVVTTGSAVTGTAIEYSLATIDLFYVMDNVYEDITVKKVWSGGQSPRPAVTIRLLADGEEVGQVVLTDGKTAHTFNLPKYSSETGKEIKYTIIEDPVADYTSSIDGFTVTNTYNGEEEPEEPSDELYEVTYNSNYGTGGTVVDEKKYAAGDIVTVLANTFTRSGYNFTGWNTAANGSGTSYQPGDTFNMPEGGITLYAQWTSTGGTDPGGGDTGPGGGGTGGGGGGGTIIEDLEVPLADLERVDHFAYLIGYPEGDIRPLNNITREEVAMIFYRLLTDESRLEFLSDENPFTDVESDRWSNRAISTLYNADIISGYPDGTFRPTAPITRAEFATIAAKFDDLDLGSPSRFTDIAGHWAEDYITSAENKGWIKGYPDMTFKPEQDILRAEVVTLVNNVLERIVKAENIHPDAMFWPDVPRDAWYFAAMMEATNSHDYMIDEDGEEVWTGMKPNKLWD